MISIENKLKKNEIIKKEYLLNEIKRILVELKRNVFLNKTMLFLDAIKHETNSHAKIGHEHKC